MMKKLLAILFTVLLFAVSGCSETANDKESTGYQVTDSRNVTLHFAKKPQRIVSLFPSTDEVLLTLVDHRRILALSKWSRDLNFSNVATEAESVPLIAENTPEFLLKNKADLVITRPDMGQNPAFLKSLGEMGIPVYVFKGPTSIEEVKAYILELGNVTGDKESAQRIVQKMDAELSALEERLNALQLSKQKAVIWTSRGVIGGKGTITHDVLTRAHLIDVLDNYKVAPGASMNREIIVESNPDVIIVIGFEASGNKVMDEIIKDPALQTVKAIRDRKVVLLPIRYTSCNSQYLVQGIKNLASAVYNKNF